jgi:hypothetical protein
MLVLYCFLKFVINIDTRPGYIVVLWKELRKMPWYTNPVKTCKVLNKIAKRYEHTALHELKTVMDDATSLLWKKQEQYYECSQNNFFNRQL